MVLPLSCFVLHEDKKDKKKKKKDKKKALGALLYGQPSDTPTHRASQFRERFLRVCQDKKSKKRKK